MLEIKPRWCVPLRSVCVPFINMHNGRVHDVTHCYNLGKKCVPPSNYVPSSIYNEVDSRFLSRGNEKLLKSQRFTRR